MGRSVWVAGQDGSVHTLEGQTLRVSAVRRKVHAGYVSGLCPLVTRTSRACWSYSLADDTVCVWRSEEVESQAATEAAAALGAKVAALEAQLQQ
eukprot:2800521-Prymnesium_polylepis.1